ncbi:MAG: spore coat protein CotJB [Caldicoprobacterales bacterium]
MIRNQREMLLDRIRAYEFAAVEINLYLNSHPRDQRALIDFDNISRQIVILKNEYERLYGPLINFGFGLNSNRNQWQWINDPWPWEGV